MSALTTGRLSPQMSNHVEYDLIGVPMDAVKIYIGSLVFRNVSGYAVPGSADNTLVASGIAYKVQPDANKGGIPGPYVDNSAGSAGDRTIVVVRGTFKLVNGDSIALADVGKPCFASDDQTVNKSSSNGSRPLAGEIVQVDTDGVWVAIGKLPRSTYASIAINDGPAGAALTDADATIQLTGGTWRKLPAATLSAGRNLTLGNTGAYAGAKLTITRLDATANTYTIKDNTSATLVVLPASKVNFADFQHDGTNWFLKRCGTQ